MGQIARLLDIPTSTPHCMTPPNYALMGMRSERKSVHVYLGVPYLPSSTKYYKVPMDHSWHRLTEENVSLYYFVPPR